MWAAVGLSLLLHTTGFAANYYNGTGNYNLSNVNYSTRLVVSHGANLTLRGNNTSNMSDGAFTYNGYLGTNTSSGVASVWDGHVTLAEGSTLNVTGNHTVPQAILVGAWTGFDSYNLIQASRGSTFVSNGTLNLTDNCTTNPQITGLFLPMVIASPDSSLISNGALNLTVNHSGGMGACLVGIHGNVTLNGPTKVNIYAAEPQIGGLQVEEASHFIMNAPTLDIDISASIDAPNRDVYGFLSVDNNSWMDIKANTQTTLNISGSQANNYGLAAVLGSKTTVEDGANMQIKIADGKESVGVLAMWNNAQVLANGDLDLEVHGDTAMGVQVGDGSTAEFNGNLAVKSDQYALVLNGSGTQDATININQAGGKAVQLTGDILADRAKAVAKVKLDGAEDYFIGASYLNATNTGQNLGTVNLDLSQGSTWNLTKDSRTTDLTLNNSILNMTYSGNNKYETLQTDSFLGDGGELLLSTDLASSYDNSLVQGTGVNSDRIKIIKDSAGTHVVNIRDSSLDTNIKAEGYLLLIEDCYWQDRDYSNMATFVGGDISKGGIFRYTPVITNTDPEAEDGYGGVTTDVRPDGCGGPGVGSNPSCTNPDHVWTKQSWYLQATRKTDKLVPSVQGNLASAAVRYLGYYRELDNLLLRLGELRDNPNSEGVWVRMKRGQENIGSLGLRDSSYFMAQLGYDHKYKEDAKGKGYYGLGFSHTSSSQNYEENATGDSSVNSLSLYNTWLGNKGHYYDLVLRAGQIKKDFDYAETYLWAAEHGESSSWFYNISGEYGRKIIDSQTGWYVEPQGQLTLGLINASNYTSSQGTRVHNDGVHSAVLRVGTTIGKQWEDKEQKNKSNFYGKVFFNREFGGALGMNLLDRYGDTFETTEYYGGNWWTAGFGGTVQLDKKTDIYLDAEKTFGGKIATKWQINGGVRWSF